MSAAVAEHSERDWCIGENAKRQTGVFEASAAIFTKSIGGLFVSECVCPDAWYVFNELLL